MITPKELPEGLKFDETNGTLFGLPTRISNDKREFDYTVRAENMWGSQESFIRLVLVNPTWSARE